MHATHERVVITCNGEPAAVVLSPDDLASVEQSLVILSDENLMAQVAQARAEIDAAGESAGDGVTTRPMEDPRRS